MTRNFKLAVMAQISAANENNIEIENLFQCYSIQQMYLKKLELSE